MDLAQFQSGRNLGPQQTRAKEVVERMKTSMAQLAAKDGGKDDFQPAEGSVIAGSSYRWDNWSGPRNQTSETIKFDPKTKSIESYDRSHDMESPYGDTGSNTESFRVDQQGREHYTFNYVFNGCDRENSEIVIDKSGNLVQLFGTV